MTTPSLPQDRAALIDKDYRVTLPYRKWMNDVTKRLAEISAGSGPIIPTTTQAFTIGGTGWIQVTGSVESGHFDVTQRTGLTTNNLPEGSKPYANHTFAAYDFAADADVVLTADEYRNAFLEMTDTGPVLTAGRDVEFPAEFPVLMFKNSTAQTLTLKKNGQTGVAVAAGALAIVAPGILDVETV